MKEGQQQAAGVSQQSSHTGRTVVLVENDVNLRGLIEMLLRREGYLVVTMANLEACQQRQQGSSADLLILDLAPTQTGAAAIPNQLRVASAGGRMPVLMLSSYSETECRARLPDLDAAGFLPKPFSNRDLIAAVRGIIPGPTTSTWGGW
jgi:two-component system, OmpR family, response regulator